MATVKLDEGGLVLPLVAQATGASILKVADPFLYQALPFYQWALQTYLAAAYEAALAGQATATAGTNACLTTSPANPIPFLEAGLINRPPLLAIWPVKGRWERRTMQHDHVVDEYRLAYVLPAMAWDQMQRVGPLLQAAHKLLTLVTEKQAFPDYTPKDGTAGAIVWKAAGTERVQFAAHEFGAFEKVDTAGSYMPCLFADIEVASRDSWDTTNATTYLDSLLKIGIGTSSDGILADAIEAQTDVG